jgi:UDP-N-acetylmuramoylalanine--D-glutamate ligase
MDLKGQKVVVLGLGETGLSMTRWLARRGAAVRVADSRAAPPRAATLARELPGVPVATGKFSDATLAGADLVAISPGIDRREAPVAAAIRRGVPVVGDIELFAQALPTLVGSPRPTRREETIGSPSSPKVIAITGSNGKSTVTAMAGEMCKAAGRETVVAGNIGLPVLDALTAIEDGAPAPEAFVLELSSFQLESTDSLVPDAATVLNVTEDHLDRYESIADYARAKARIFARGGAQVVNRDDRLSLAMVRGHGHARTFGLRAPRNESEWGIAGSEGDRQLAHGRTSLLRLSELPLAGLHNAANALAASALANAIGLPDAPLAGALRRFEGLPHRMRKVAEIAGVAWYDDSKGTNVGATVAALSGMDRPVVLIAGGDGKGQDFSPLAPAVKSRAHAVVLIGRDAALIERAIARAGARIRRAADMDEAVAEAAQAARSGDAVLLSPACASYDMYRDYVQRAEVFAAAVRRLREGRG